MEFWQASQCWILIKISHKLHKDIPIHLTPCLCSSGTSKTPGKDMEDRWSLDRVPDVWLMKITQKLHRYSSSPSPGPRWTSMSSKTSGRVMAESFVRMLLFIWLHFQVNHEPPCPSRLQEETCSKDGGLTGSWGFFLMIISQKVHEDAPNHLTPSPG